MFEPLLTLVALVAAVLVISGATKLAAPSDVASAFVDLRVPRALAGRPQRLALPWAEILMGLGLLFAPAPLATVLAAAATVLMAAYTVLIGRALGFEERVSCACFGRWGSAQVTRGSLARNVMLLGAACGTVVWTIVDGSPVAAAVWTSPTAAWWLLGAAVVGAVAWLAAGFSPVDEVRDTAEDTAGEEGEYLRTPIPFAYLERAGVPVTLRELAAPRAQLLIWVRPACGGCHGLAGELPRMRERLGGRVDVELVSRFPDAEAGLVDPEGTVTRLLELQRLPAAVLLGADGLLAGGPVEGRPDVDALVSDIADELAS
ncbi:MauE/DoxX family redox-associated membrane protein [Tessaracoccus palaemonis]|uniref:Methylamine utilisation protein MauE domain-containing protein n=1 Tax=Tessaracoccus palaemonis TaxID=2829499 RepID=A0ABX8SHS7_9ACTN|nr:MauE/DoxX family redox-associated membrane protein [Tessaracoccus palaemonis]QXT62941.1 hypothetical protein KDB89_00145 [Tessaracoccus palaemonis]